MYRKKATLLEDTLFQTLIAAISQTLARLANLKTAKLYQQAISEIEKDLEELLGLKADLARRLSDDHILEMLTTNEVLDIGRLYYVAELLREEGEIQDLLGSTTEGRASQTRALNLFLESAFASGNKLPGVADRVNTLGSRLLDVLSEDTLFSLFDYFEQQGQFASAERALDQMLVLTHNNPDLLFEQKDFYRRLLQQTDSELEAGGLSRSRIEQKLANL